MIVTIENIERYLLFSGLVLSPVYPITKWEHFEIQEPIKVELSNGEIINIPHGFTFDGSSAPRFIWNLFPSYGDFLFAALIHDFMYKTDYKRKELGTYKAQKFADDEMLIWSNLLHSNKIGNKLRHLAVRIFGKNIYIQ